MQCYLEKYFVHQQDSSFPDVRLGGHKLVEKKMGEFTSIPGAPTINMGNSIQTRNSYLGNQYKWVGKKASQTPATQG